MTRMRKAMYLEMKGETIKWHYYQGPKQGRIFFDEINGNKFKRTPADQQEANEMIDELFEYWSVKEFMESHRGY